MNKKKSIIFILSCFFCVVTNIFCIPTFGEEMDNPIDYSNADETDPVFVTGWEWDEATGQYRYCFENGSYAYGLVEIDGNWYWFDENGFRFSGWLRRDSKWFYFDADGIMAVGWQNINQKWYFLDLNSGVMKEGWLEWNGNWYYLSPKSGEMAEGWLKWNNNWYYLFPGSGAMVCDGWYTIRGKRYCFFADGRWNQNAELRTLTSAIDTASTNAGWYVSVTNGTLSEATVKKLNNDMLDMWNAGFDVGFLLLDINTKTVISGNPNKYFYSASTLKGPYVCAIALKEASRAVNYKDQIWATISQSNNEAYSMLRSTFGSGIMSSYMSEAGVTGVSADESYTDERVKDLAKLWVRNYEFFCLEEANVSWLRPYFQHTDNSFIDAAIGNRHIVYSKPGWTWGPTSHHVVYNDGGIVMKSGAPYILVMLSNGRSGIDDAKLRKFVRDLDEAHNEISGAGWVLEDHNWYYKDGKGHKLTGWQFIDGSWYYLDPLSESMQTDWVRINSIWYYFNDSGVMATGWKKVGDNWYYMKPSGAMQIGWVKVDNIWYYLKKSGAMAASEWSEGYWLNANGSWTYLPKGSWKKGSKGWWFGDTSGWYAKNETLKINNVDYSFDEEGYWIE